MPELMQEQTGAFDQADIDSSKTMAGLAYLIFFLPLLVCPQSKYARFHANQALLLLIVSIAGTIILSFIPVLGWFLLPLFGLFIFVLFVMGLINGFNGKAKRLPVFGKFDILK